MTRQALVTRVVVTLAGTILAGSSYWGLLNVPESNVLALGLSALLVLLTLVIPGVTIALVLAHAAGRSLAESVPWALRRIPAFLLGVVIVSALWWLTTFIESQWALHRGEIDAMFLRYAGTANTAWMHTIVVWVMWLLRWALGLAVVAAFTAGRPSLALSGGPLGAMVAALLLGWGLSVAAFWRPNGLTANAAELAFVSAKLGTLALAGALLVVGVLGVFAKHAHAAPRQDVRSPM